MRINLKSVLMLIVWAALAGWIALEAMSAAWGPASYRALEARRADLAGMEEELARLKARREQLTRRANMLNDRHIDAELLDERIRVVLGYAVDGEWVANRDEIERRLGLEAPAGDRNGR